MSLLFFICGTGFGMVIGALVHKIGVEWQRILDDNYWYSKDNWEDLKKSYERTRKK